MSFEIGQKLFYVPNRNYGSDLKGKYITITKVGRKWLFLDDSELKPTKIDKNTMRADGGNYSSPGRAYLSEEEYLIEIKRNNLWGGIKSKMDWSCPKHLSLEDLEQIAKKLFNIG